MRWLLAALWFCAAPALAADKSLEGADDPQFLSAVETYLEGEDVAALRSLSAMANDGNVAAQLLLGRIANTVFAPGWDTLSVEEQRALSRDMSGGGFGRTWTFRAEEADNAFAMALKRIKDVHSETWVEDARLLLAYGEREAVLDMSSEFLKLRNNADGLELLESVATPADIANADIWSGLLVYSAFHRTGKLSQDDQWEDDPWTPAHEAAFQDAYRAGYLSALLGQQYRNVLAQMFVPEWAGFPGVERYAEQLRLMQLPFIGPGGAGFEAQDVIRLGDVLISDARRGGPTRPWMGMCRKTCEASVSHCVATAYLTLPVLGKISAWPPPLETVIPSERWYGAPQLETIVLNLMKQRRQSDAWETILAKVADVPLDQCFLDLVSAD